MNQSFFTYSSKIVGRSTRELIKCLPELLGNMQSLKMLLYTCFYAAQDVKYALKGKTTLYDYF